MKNPVIKLSHSELIIAACRWALIRARARGVACEVQIYSGQEDVVALLPDRKILVIEVKTSWADYQKEWVKRKWFSTFLNTIGSGNHYYCFFAQAGLAKRIACDIDERGLKFGVISHPRRAINKHQLIGLMAQALRRRKPVGLHWLNQFEKEAETRILRRQSWQIINMLHDKAMTGGER